MLYLVLGLVLAAFGLLIAALTTANTLFAWLSVAVSVLAAGLLVFDWLAGRRRAREAAEEAEPDPVLARPERPFGAQTPPLAETAGGGSARAEPLRSAPAAVPPERPGPVEPEPVERDLEPAVFAEPPEKSPAEAPAEPPVERAPEPPAELPAERPAEQPVEQPAGSRSARPPAAEEVGEPGEEQTDAADLLVVADLRFEVRVVDEHPRYHLATCGYLHDKPTIPLPVAEARQLGFTPCVRCGPDATLAARHRATRY